MWVATNRGFLSVVTADYKRLPKAERKHRRTGEFLCVRARNADHLSDLFPGHRIYKWPGRDYPARIFIDRADFADFMVREVNRVTYPNFKNSVRDPELHDAYMGVWSVMHRYQHGAYKPTPRPGYGSIQEWGHERFNDRPTWEELPGPRRDPFEGGALDEEVCGLLGCTPADPCRDCVSNALGQEDRDTFTRETNARYGDFDSGDERDDDDLAQGHRRIPPA